MNNRMVVLLVSLLLMIGSTFSYAGQIDGVPTIDESSPSGFYIWRTANDRIEVRNIANTGVLRVNSVFSSESGFRDLERVSVENHDSITTTGTQLISELATWAGNYDGLSILGDATQDLCLQSLSGANVYLGEQTVRATAPVDLSGTGACGTASNPGNPSSPDIAEGIYVLRKSSSSFQLRLVSSEEPQSFSGTVSSIDALGNLTAVSLESNDDLIQNDLRSFDISMRAWPGGFDGVDFDAPGSGVCIKAAPDNNIRVFLGAQLDDAVEVPLPLDVTGSNACSTPGGPIVTPEPPVVTPTSRKSNYGHYVRLQNVNDKERGMNQALKPGVRGVLKSYFWYELEPTRGNYDFSQVARDLEYLAARGMQLVVMIEDKTFRQDERALPNYLANNDTQRVNRDGGFSGIRWSPVYINRIQELIAALGQQFDSEPAFEGIALQESAPGLDDPILDATGYTPERYRDAYIDILTSASESLATSRVFWYMNYLPRGNALMGDVLEAVHDLGVVAGGPDVLPDSRGLQTHSYPVLRNYISRMPMFNQIEGICYRHEHLDTSFPTKYWTPNELFKYARDNLAVNYLFWNNIPNAIPSDSYDIQDAFPVMANNPVINN